MSLANPFPSPNPIAVDDSRLQSFPSLTERRRKMSLDQGAVGTSIFRNEINAWSRYYEMDNYGKIETFHTTELENFARAVTAISKVRAPVSNLESHTNLRINSRRGSSLRRRYAATTLLILSQTMYVFHFLLH